MGCLWASRILPPADARLKKLRVDQAPPCRADASSNCVHHRILLSNPTAFHSIGVISALFSHQLDGCLKIKILACNQVTYFAHSRECRSLFSKTRLY
jgi:hypothetical protein